LFANQFSGGEPGVDRSDIFIRGTATYGNKAPIVIRITPLAPRTP
jgi:hypothetical protein